MKQKIRTIIFGLIFFIGLGLVCYPSVSDLISQHNQSKVVDQYENSVKKMTTNKLKKIKKAAVEYNKSLVGNVVLTDPFDADALKEINKDYEKLLNPAGDGVMGYVKIPTINVNLPIYHGTDKKTLEKGVGHLVNSSLPVGGENTHAVLSGHTGLPSSKLFTDLDQLKSGDHFYLYVLDEVLAYEVDQVKVVTPDDTDDLLISMGHDYVTLVTCTPYGVNSHRLLVRGKRVPYTRKQITEQIRKEEKTPWWFRYLIILVVVLVFVIGFFVIRARRKRNKKGDANEKTNS